MQSNHESTETELSIQHKNVKPKLVIRNATLSDVQAVLKLTSKVYPQMPPYSIDMLRGQVNNYSDGQFVAVYEDSVVGYCATFRISEDIALKRHTWKEITGGGFASRHDPHGDYLYGMEICVDPDYRGLRIGQRLYQERKKLCKHLRLKGIVFGGRLPGLRRKLAKVDSPEHYLELVKQKKFRDPVLSFQLRNGFEVVGLLKDYLPMDQSSLGYATHLVWKNPQISALTEKAKHKRGRLADSVRVGTVQYKLRSVRSFDEFARYVEYFVDVVADYEADFVTFPELFTLQLLSMEKDTKSPSQSLVRLTDYTDQYRDLMSQLSIKYNINIIGGTHPTKYEDGIYNVCYVFLRDGAVYHQAKIQTTPNERFWWNMQGGSELSTIMTDCGPIGILICYDCEFPELARHLANQGAQILFVPFCTDERQSYLRVRYCAQARAIENQCYVVLSGNVGNLPGVNNMDIQYAQSSIFTPCDFPFARDGIAADTTPNVETVAIADLKLDSLISARNMGTVQNLKDRRFDLYSVAWHQKN